MPFVNRCLASPTISGQIAIWLTTLITAMLTAFMMRINLLSSLYLPTCSYVINLLSLALGGFVAGRKAKERGWYYGLMQGAIYSSAIFIVSFLSNDQGLTPYFLGNGAILCLLSTVTGVLGVNTAPVE
ncbi:MAG: hypothetical protein RLZ12_34 [Bacillota bacterium]|jgi:putative membrane protein (TIGR04086 family)